MDWLAKYWWILVIVFLVGVLLNVIKDLKRVDHTLPDATLAASYPAWE